MADIPVLTIRQPYAWAITHEAAAPQHRKPVENRNWRTGYCGPLWLHAGARSRWDPDGADSRLIREAWAAWIASPGMRARTTAVPDLALARRSPLIDFGAVTALAEVTGCHHARECLVAGELCSGWAVAGQFHIQLADVRPLPEPVPCRGALGFWRLAPADAAACEAQIPAMRRG